ncbi:hypothetical protein AU195_07345 [Mycobacterium sp. IS-1496]|uniref:DUF2561 family protein n=1 Tax=Mycobacterium sp. IS-1496 TaxID=1772284 RepID=UPI00074152D7|nr:DUF2561 family protein [Mycobacterium sp. IS-1496]KUI22701.1 hypothetical protein AU195_07345 [Mycobacterium sp. IS-1496]
MAGSATAAARSGAAAERLNRILLGVCAAVWLIALGAAVAATVALTELGRSQPAASSDGDTPWLLYTVIGVSAAVIIGSVPLLLRARRTAHAEPEAVVLPRERSTATDEPATEKLRVAPVVQQVPSRLDPGLPTAEVDRLWLQCALVLGIAMGVAMIAIGAATYLMAVGSDTVSWVLYALTALVTLAMPVAPWWYLRELRALDEPAA